MADVGGDLPHDLALIRRVLMESAHGLTRPQLFAALRKELPRIQPQQVRDALQLLGDRVVEREGRLSFIEDPAEPSPLGRTQPVARPLRVVALDIESVVRLITKAPYTEKHIYQLAGLRFGPDKAWVKEQREFDEFVELDARDEILLQSETVRLRYAQRRRPRAEVLEAFRAFIRDADVLVAYNGVSHDFVLLDEECARSEIPPFVGAERVDGLYLALALWPVPPRHHRLRVLFEHLQLGVEQFTWHEALDDARMLALLLEHGARWFATRDPQLQALVLSAARDSAAWTMLFSLSGSAAAPRDFTEREVSETLARALAPKPPARAVPSTAPGALPVFSIPDGMWQDGVPGTVDVHRLANSAKGGAAEPRHAQQEMGRLMRAWVKAGTNALVEAPTGTGKTYPMLATALEWLAADSDHRVVISTFTKQLQLQIARDIEELGLHAIPGLIATSDMVKGSSNRLSLRAITLALAQLASTDGGVPRGGRPDYSRDVRYRDLVIYLALRAIASGSPTEEWESRSVDPVDVPAFFEDYCGRRRSLYLVSLSQARSGELDLASGPLARYAATVEEALQSHRLIIANHALLLANLDALAPLGPKTLLLVDEAHTLEGAATDALSSEVASSDLEDLVTDVVSWRADQTDALGALDEVVDEIGQFLSLEVLPQAAVRAFDASERRLPGPEYPRRIVVASPFVSETHARQMRDLSRALGQAARFVGRLRGVLRGVPPRSEPYENERLNMLRSRVGAADDALTVIRTDLNTLFAPTPPTPNGPVMQSAPADGPATEAEEQAEADAGELPAEVPEVDAPPPLLLRLSNRVVWAEELPGPSVAARMRAYRFRVTSSPVELGDEAAYRQFTRTFARTYYISATLRVAGSWDYMLRRLGLAGQVETIALPSPFDLANQARLVCFSDCPSWAEETERAIKTIAHQVSRYAHEAIDGARNGAMVLTTAKATAAGISEYLVQMRASAEGRYQVLATELLGNQRAVETFKEQGGVLVGTKGLWQGVDIADPQRLRMVVVNKLPFASFVDPIIATRRALVRERAEAAGADDPDAVANETYYLPLAAIELRQAVGRLIRSRDHRGVVVITDRKLSGAARLNRLYREVFLGSLDPRLAVRDAETNETWGGNVVPTREGWRRIWTFLSAAGVVTPARVAELTTDTALEEQSELPETLALRREGLTPEAEQALRAEGADVFAADFLARCARIGGFLKLSANPLQLKDKQAEALRAIADGKDLLAILPTGYGKSFCFQLPALALSGVTVVVSPLVSLMTDQALELNRSIGGAVRALVAPMRESNSRTGKTEIHRQLTDPTANLGIKLVYLSPERLCQRQFQDWIRRGVELEIIRRIAIDEAHTFVQWGDDFRPSFRRAELFLRDVKRATPSLQLLAFTATANAPVREGLRRSIFGIEPGSEDPNTFASVVANPVRPDLAVYRRAFGRGDGGHVRVAGLLERVVDSLGQHAIFYCLTIKEVEAHYAHLRDYLGDQRDRVRRYHGRMSSVERSAVANDFRSAPRFGEEGFRPMIVIATSAFGLGIDRPDIRCVFVVSPPTDLAALYQQLGRAGRDGQGGAGLALATASSFRTIVRMTRRRTDEQLITRTVALLQQSGSFLDLRAIAQQLMSEDLDAHRLSADDAAKSQTEDRYHIGVVRTLAELASRDVVDDLGDFPMEVALKPGTLVPDTSEMVEWVDAMFAAQRGAKSITIPALYDTLRPRFGEELGDHGGLWSELLRLHTAGYLDVSQAPNVGRGYFTAVRVRRTDLPDGFTAGLERRQQVVDTEVARLADFFRESRTCANDLIARYFGAAELPDGTCATPDCRCSACWSRRDLVGPNDQEPATLVALSTPNALPQAALTARRRRELDRHIERLLWLNFYGLGATFIQKVLRGEELYRVAARCASSRPIS